MGVGKVTDNYHLVRTQSKKRFGFGVERMKEIKVCSYCGSVSDSAKLFCHECSKLLPKETLYMQYQKRHRICNNCKTVVTNHMKYCPDCGQKL